jgi:hypothetical protein
MDYWSGLHRGHLKCGMAEKVGETPALTGDYWIQ